MARKIDVKDIDLQLDETDVFVNKELEVAGINLMWSAKIGFGEYWLRYYPEEKKWTAYSECMDRGDDKEFLRELLNKLVDQIEIEG